MLPSFAPIAFVWVNIDLLCLDPLAGCGARAVDQLVKKGRWGFALVQNYNRMEKSLCRLAQVTDLDLVDFFTDDPPRRSTIEFIGVKAVSLVCAMPLLEPSPRSELVPSALICLSRRSAM